MVKDQCNPEATLIYERLGISILSALQGYPKDSYVHETAILCTSPHDITDCNGLTYDVKFAYPYSESLGRKTSYWSFDMRGKRNYCHYVLLLGMKRGKYINSWLIPNHNLPIRNLRISEFGKTKWKKYEVDSSILPIDICTTSFPYSAYISRKKPIYKGFQGKKSRDRSLFTVGESDGIMYPIRRLPKKEVKNMINLMCSLQ